jgi:hypothetical protein
MPTTAPWRRLSLLVAALLACPLAGFSPATIGVTDAEQIELKGGLAAVGASTSDEPAARAERQAREPSRTFLLGASLGAWRNAAAALRYDLQTPSGDGDDTEAIAEDCYDEKTAFAHLEARRQSLGLTPPQVAGDAGLSDGALLDAWRARQSAPPKGCR